MHSAVAPIQDSTLVVVCPGTVARYTSVTGICRHDSIAVTEAGSLLNVSPCQRLRTRGDSPYLTS
jgi:hypothetical protein